MVRGRDVQTAAPGRTGPRVASRRVAQNPDGSHEIPCTLRSGRRQAAADAADAASAPSQGIVRRLRRRASPRRGATTALGRTPHWATALAPPSRGPSRRRPAGGGTPLPSAFGRTRATWRCATGRARRAHGTHGPLGPDNPFGGWQGPLAPSDYIPHCSSCWGAVGWGRAGVRTPPLPFGCCVHRWQALMPCTLSFEQRTRIFKLDLIH